MRFWVDLVEILSWLGWIIWVADKLLSSTQKSKFSFQITTKEHDTTTKIEKSIKNQWFSSKGKGFHNPWLKTCDEEEDPGEAFEKFFNPTPDCLWGV